uniref:Uncharacterized protein n=1 Tax=Oryzias sinensis TaxID=183150 RepID=A0A8C7XGI2_9TELE
MPIWSVMWLQVPGTLSAMVFTFSFLKSGEVRVRETTTLFRLSESRATMVSSRSNRLLSLRCRTERLKNSFVPTAIRLFNEPA